MVFITQAFKYFAQYITERMLLGDSKSSAKVNKIIDIHV